MCVGVCEYREGRQAKGAKGSGLLNGNGGWFPEG